MYGAIKILVEFFVELNHIIGNIEIPRLPCPDPVLFGQPPVFPAERSSPHFSLLHEANTISGCLVSKQLYL